jgi:hypothetical protein
VAANELIDRPTGQVTGLALTSLTKLQAVVSWSAFSTAIADTGNSPITSYLVERNCTGCSYAPSGWFTLSANSLATSLTIPVSATEQNGMTYNRVYKVRVTPLNICGAGYNPVSIDLTTKVAPSAPLVAFPPVKTALSATLITVTWPALGISEDDTGGYAITGY